VGILAIEPETRLQRPLAVVGLTPEEEPGWWAELDEHPTRYGEGAEPALLARFEAGEALVVDMTQPPYDQLPNPYGITTTLVAPMRARDEVVGLLSLDFGGERHTFAREDLALAQAVAQLAALTIERERLVRERAEAQASELAIREVNQRLDDFVGIAAHDLKSPVTSSNLHAQLVARRNQRLAARWRAVDAKVAQQFEEMQAPLDTVVHDLDRLSHLTKRLLDVTRIRTGKLDLNLEPLDLAAIVRECVEEQRRLAPERALELDQPEARAIPVLADPDRLGQVITNFLTNALRYAPPDRPISVSITPRHDDQGETVNVAVRDEGPGIPVAEQARIWARFEQVHGKSARRAGETGLGLGLYISREIIEQHGGTIGVESAPDAGATFWFTLRVLTA
jgi:signal transduction histidine kinase